MVSNGSKIQLKSSKGGRWWDGARGLKEDHPRQNKCVRNREEKEAVSDIAGFLVIKAMHGGSLP